MSDIDHSSHTFSCIWLKKPAAEEVCSQIPKLPQSVGMVCMTLIMTLRSSISRLCRSGLMSSSGIGKLVVSSYGKMSLKSSSGLKWTHYDIRSKGNQYLL
jgi:hypothetical protein